MLRLNSGFDSFGKELFQAFILEAYDHELNLSWPLQSSNTSLVYRGDHFRTQHEDYALPKPGLTGENPSADYFGWGLARKA